MGISCVLADGSEEALPEAPGTVPGEAETLLIVLARPASGKLRKQHALAAGAPFAGALASVARLDLGVLEPLLRHSTCIYTEADYLDQFSEDWEREEYRPYAAEVIAANHAAWQDSQSFLRAVDAALVVAGDPAAQKLLASELPHVEVAMVLRRLRERVASAVSKGAVKVAVELDGLD